MATATKTAEKKVTKKAVPAKKDAPKDVFPTELPVYGMDGKKVSTIALPAEIFAVTWRADMVHQVVTGMEANKRQNRAHTKDRSEVSGGGKKPWKQKGTGQARHSSTRSPLWRHGGVTFGPRKERDYSEKINRKQKVAALLSVLSRKSRDGEIILVDSLSFAEPKTAEAKNFVAALAKGADAERLGTKRKNAALVALSAHNTATVKSFRNMGNIATEEARSLNPVDVIKYKYLVIEKPEEVFAALAKRAATK